MEAATATTAAAPPQRRRSEGHRRSAASRADGRAVADPDRRRRGVPDHLRDLALAARVLPSRPRASRAGRVAGLRNYTDALQSLGVLGGVQDTRSSSRSSRSFWSCSSASAWRWPCTRRSEGRALLRTVVLVPWAVLTVVTAIIWQTIFEPNLGLREHGAGTLHPGETVWLGAEAAGAGGHDHRRRLEDGAVHGAAHPRRPAGHPGRRLRGREGRRRQRRGSASRRITLPLLMPAILVALIFRTLDALRIFDLPFVLTKGAERHEHAVARCLPGASGRTRSDRPRARPCRS